MGIRAIIWKTENIEWKPKNGEIQRSILDIVKVHTWWIWAAVRFYK